MLKCPEQLWFEADKRIIVSRDTLQLASHLGGIDDGTLVQELITTSSLTIEETVLVDWALRVEQDGLYIEALHREGQIVQLPNLLFLELVVTNLLICFVKGVYDGHLVGEIRVELHAEAVDEVELEPNQVFLHFFAVLAGFVVGIGVVETEHVLDAVLQKDFSKSNTVRQC